MKNKHLVLLFLAALVIGLITRGWPWKTVPNFEAELIKIDTSSLSQLAIRMANRPELILERTEKGWVAIQGSRTTVVAPQMIKPLLLILSDVRSGQIIRSSRPDTFGLSNGESLQLSIWNGKNDPDLIKIGRSLMIKGLPACYIQLGQHEEIFFIQTDLRAIFNKTMLDFRDEKVISYDPSLVTGFSIGWNPGMGVDFNKAPDQPLWISITGVNPPVPEDSVQAWLQQFEHLNTCRFADYFDETNADGKRLARIQLIWNKGNVTLDFFHVSKQDLPEEYRDFGNPKTLAATYFVHSSQNSSNYFALQDTALAHRICYGLRRPEPVTTHPDNEN
jgi:hypothetical protein